MCCHLENARARETTPRQNRGVCCKSKFLKIPSGESLNLTDRAISLQALEAAVANVTTAYVSEIKARRTQLERLTDQAQGLLSDSAAATSNLTNRSDSDAIKESHRLEASRKLAKQLALKNDKLTYSSRELDKNVVGVDVAKGVLESFVKKYIKSGHPNDATNGGEEDSSRSPETGWKGWFRNF